MFEVPEKEATRRERGKDIDDQREREATNQEGGVVVLDFAVENNFNNSGMSFMNNYFTLIFVG